MTSTSASSPMLQDDCRTPLARIGEAVGLSAPAVLERIKKLEAAGVITGYHAILDARRLGLDVTAFIGVHHQPPEAHRASSSARWRRSTDVLECHHVTGELHAAPQGEDGEHLDRSRC